MGTEEINVSLKTVKSSRALVLFPRITGRLPNEKTWTLFHSVPHRIEVIIVEKGRKTNYYLIVFCGGGGLLPVIITIIIFEKKFRFNRGKELKGEILTDG